MSSNHNEFCVGAPRRADDLNERLSFSKLCGRRDGGPGYSGAELRDLLAELAPCISPHLLGNARGERGGRDMHNRDVSTWRQRQAFNPCEGGRRPA